MFLLCSHSLGGIILLNAKIIATVFKESPKHLYGETFHLSSKGTPATKINDATVIPLVVHKSGSCSHYLGGIMPLNINYIATVNPSDD